MRGKCEIELQRKGPTEKRVYAVRCRRFHRQMFVSCASSRKASASPPSRMNIPQIRCGIGRRKSTAVLRCRHHIRLRSLSCVRRRERLWSRSAVLATTAVQSSQSLAISVRTLPMTCALAISPCCSPSRILTSHLRINRPSHRTLSTGTRESLLP